MALEFYKHDIKGDQDEELDSRCDNKKATAGVDEVRHQL